MHITRDAEHEFHKHSPFFRIVGFNYGFPSIPVRKKKWPYPLSYKFAICFLLKFFLLKINFRSKGDAIHRKAGERFEEIFSLRK
jgi:hypothetical protein